MEDLDKCKSECVDLGVELQRQNKDKSHLQLLDDKINKVLHAINNLNTMVGSKLN